jgi:single-stranded DNA-binding protein
MREMNKVWLLGRVKNRVSFQTTRNGTQACSFTLEWWREGPNKQVSAQIKINAYGDDLVRVCKSHLFEGHFVIVDGELMNRLLDLFDAEGKPVSVQLTEVRLWNVYFLGGGRSEARKKYELVYASGDRSLPPPEGVSAVYGGGDVEDSPSNSRP